MLINIRAAGLPSPGAGSKQDADFGIYESGPRNETFVQQRSKPSDVTVLGLESSKVVADERQDIGGQQTIVKEGSQVDPDLHHKHSSRSRASASCRSRK